MSTQDIIDSIVSNHEPVTGNSELTILYRPDDQDSEQDWEVHYGNPNKAVNLGEVSGEYVTTGATLLAALSNMVLLINS